MKTNVKNRHNTQIKLSKVQTCMTDLASYSLRQWQFWQLTSKWLSGACKQYYCCFLHVSFSFNYAIQSKPITWLMNFALNCTWKPILHASLRNMRDIGCRTQFNAEFTNQIMNFLLLNIVAAVVVQIFLLFEYLQTSSVPDKRRV